MNKGLRFTERWMHISLWLLALVFASFLIGLGQLVVQHVYYVGEQPTLEQYLDPAQADPLQRQMGQAQQQFEQASERFDQASQKLAQARADTSAARDSFEAWRATRRATDRPEQDSDLIARTEALDALSAKERTALAAVQSQQQSQLDARQLLARSQAAWEKIEQPARIALEQAQRARELREFLLRLAILLPLLLVAAWLFRRQRHTRNWPFAWGFILFALFSFFFELVPYLPSYGGYVRYLVGILITVVLGRYAINWLQAYLERQKHAEALPERERRQQMRYDLALTRMIKSCCPGCERAVETKDGKSDFCPHCGIGLFDRCPGCSTRKNAFARYCVVCGAASSTQLPD